MHFDTQFTAELGDKNKSDSGLISSWPKTATSIKIQTQIRCVNTCMICARIRPGLKHRSHYTGQKYRSLFYQLVTDPNNSPRSKTAFWIVIRARRHFWACLFICSTATCTCTCHL